MRITTSLATLGAATLLLGACGGGKATAGPPQPASRAADAGAAPLTTTPPPAGLPPMAPMPPPGVAGSRKAKTRPDDALASCAGAARGASAAEQVKRAGEACATASKMRPLGALIRGSQTDKDAHQEHRFKVEAGKCYRVYFAAEDAVKDAVVVLRDSAGDVVAESPGAALPEDGAACFTQGDEVTLLVGIGSGKGAYAAQVWSD